MYNKTVLDWVIEIKDDAIALCVLRSIEIIATVVFLVGISGGRKRWLDILHFISLLESVFGLVAPKRYFGIFFEGEPDPAHIFLLQLLCCVLLCWVLGYWLLAKSTDSTTETSLLLAYTVMNFCVFLASTYMLTHPSKKPVLTMNEGLKVPMCYIDLLVLVGNMFLYLSTRDWGGYGEVMSHANFHLRLESVMLLCMGLMMYALPQWIVRLMADVDKLDSMHAFLARCTGALLLAMSLMSGRAANFLRDDNKQMVVLSHLVLYVMLMVSTAYTAVQMWDQLSWKQVAFKAFHHFVLVLNAIGALDRDPKVFRKVVLPRVKAIPRDLRACLKWKSY